MIRIMIKKVSILILIIGTVLAQSPDELFNSAQASLDAGNVAEAEAGFNAALAADPTFAPAYLGLASVAIRKGDLKEAGSKLKEAIESEPENQGYRDEFEKMNELNTLMSKGNRSMKNGDANQAFESFRVAYEKFPNYPESVFNMGLTHFRKKEFTDAVEYFQKTLEIYPDHKTASAAIRNVAKNYFNKDKTPWVLAEQGETQRTPGNYFIVEFSKVLSLSEKTAFIVHDENIRDFDKSSLKIYTQNGYLTNKLKFEKLNLPKVFTTVKNGGVKTIFIYNDNEFALISSLKGDCFYASIVSLNNGKELFKTKCLPKEYIDYNGLGSSNIHHDNKIFLSIYLGKVYKN